MPYLQRNCLIHRLSRQHNGQLLIYGSNSEVAQEFELAQLTRAAIDKSTQLGRSLEALSTTANLCYQGQKFRHVLTDVENFDVVQCHTCREIT